MCDFHSRLLTASQEFGLNDARIEHGGRRGSAGQHYGHPHLVGVIGNHSFQSLIDQFLKSLKYERPRNDIANETVDPTDWSINPDAALQPSRSNVTHD